MYTKSSLKGWLRPSTSCPKSWLHAPKLGSILFGGKRVERGHKPCRNYPLITPETDVRVGG